MNKPQPHHISSHGYESSDGRSTYHSPPPDRQAKLLTDCALGRCPRSATERHRHLVEAAAGAKRAARRPAQAPHSPFASSTRTSWHTPAVSMSDGRFSVRHSQKDTARQQRIRRFAGRSPPNSIPNSIPVRTYLPHQYEPTTHSKTNLRVKVSLVSPACRSALGN